MEHRRPLLWQLYPSYLLIIVVGLAAVSLFSAGSLKHFFLEKTKEDLSAKAYILKPEILSLLQRGDLAKVDATCKETGSASNTRFTVVLPTGDVLGDSIEQPDRMENHRDRVEIEEALAGRVGMMTRHSDTLNRTMMYVAIPVNAGKEITGVLRAAVPLTFIDEEIADIRMRIFLCGFLVVVLAAGVSLFVSRRITYPLVELRRGAQRFAVGDLQHRLYVPQIEEMAGLAEAMNQMAEQLDDRIQTVIRQRNELEAVLSSMVEGVIAVDGEGRIMRMNAAAGDMFSSAAKRFHNRSIHELVRNLDVIQMLDEALAADGPVEGDIDLYQFGKRILHTQSSPLRDAGNRRIGTLFVIQDVTQLRRLENMRRDFVANVSHEIKTPLTAIKGFVETLRDAPESDGVETERFLAIIDRNVNRLIAIIDDLLKLSSIEQDAKNPDLVLEEAAIREVLHTAVQVCQPKIDEKKIAVAVSCAAELTAKIDPALMEHAAVNLLDNALKYSPRQSIVRIDVEKEGEMLHIRFSDSGIGIPDEHLPRLFERFYRVDKARSRKLGGTGLGLAIVKHIMNVHKGSVAVESTPGKGSVFTLHLPA